MRIMMIVRLPVEPFNAAVRDGTAGEKMEHILEMIKPEAVYFAEVGGRRTGFLVVDLAEESGIPALAEPWFLHFQAEVEFHVAMTPADLRKANLESLGKKWG